MCGRIKLTVLCTSKLEFVGMGKNAKDFIIYLINRTLLMKNMYSGPGLAWEQDEGLEVCKQCLHVPLYPVILPAAFFFHCLRIPETFN